MAAHTFKAGDKVTFKDRFSSGAGEVAEVKHTSKGDFITVVNIIPARVGEPFRSVRPHAVTLAN
jgi:hypothetical protein